MSATAENAVEVSRRMPCNRVLEPVDEEMRPGTTWRSPDEKREPINDLMRLVNYWLSSSTVVSQIPPPFGVGMTRVGEFRGSHSMPANCQPMSLGQQKVDTVELRLSFRRSN